MSIGNVPITVLTEIRGPIGCNGKRLILYSQMQSAMQKKMTTHVDFISRSKQTRAHPKVRLNRGWMMSKHMADCSEPSSCFHF